jgi:hypothetical protein
VARFPAHTPGALAVEADPVVIPQGADWTLGWILAEGDPLGPPAGWPDDWTARMEVRDRRGGTLLARLHSTDGDADGALDLGTRTVTDVEGVPDDTEVATVTASLTAAVSAGWAWPDRPAPFDVELVALSGRLIRLVEGAAVLSAEVTTGE